MRSAVEETSGAKCDGSLKLLAFRLPDFTRVGWVSEDARKRWEDVLNNVRRSVSELELASVVHRARECALRPIEIAKLEAESRRLCALELALKPLYGFRLGQGYSSEVRPFEGAPTTAMCAVGTNGATEKAFTLHRAGETRELGRLLGYPECCIAFFKEIWEVKRYIDTTWPMAVNSKGATYIDDHHVGVELDPGCNMFLKSIGIRAVFHLPCSFNCAATKQLSVELARLAQVLGMGDQIRALYELLGMPARWSALHGIAEIETPIFRVSTKTDATSIRYTVDNVVQTGGVDGQAKGNRFPFVRAPTTRRVTSPIRGSQREEADPVEIVGERYYLDNGFKTRILYGASVCAYCGLR